MRLEKTHYIKYNYMKQDIILTCLETKFTLQEETININPLT